ncbi:MAG: ribosomal-processing cysteine protease Prp [Roseburia sp.]|nr:ribosomal-processing cysteine protease Prp [Roseburia sp.]
MITVSFFKKNGKVFKVSTKGHSGLAESGNDILCAAVSALVQTAYLGIVEFGGDVEYVRSEKDALFEFTAKGDTPNMRETEVIIGTLRVGLNDLSCGYPHNLKLEEL